MTTFAATTNADAFSILRSQASASGVSLGTLSDVASVALTVANILGGGASSESLPAGNVTNGTFGSVSSDTGIYSFPSQVGVGGAGSATNALRVAGTITAATGNAVGIGATSITLVAAANSDALRAASIGCTFTPGAFTALAAKMLDLSAFSVAAFTTPADPISLNIGIVTGTGATNGYAIRIAPPAGATNNYLIAHTTTATFNVTAAGAMTLAGAATVGGLLTASASLAVTGAASFTTDLISTTALATPSALAATQFTGFASTVSGAAIMGFGTSNDVALMNRAGTVCLGVGPNTTLVNVPGTFSVTGLVSGGAALDLTGAPPAAAASHITYGGVTRTTIGANGAATALTANPLGYLDINVAGTIAQIPYYNRGA